MKFLKISNDYVNLEQVVLVVYDDRPRGDAGITLYLTDGETYRVTRVGDVATMRAYLDDHSNDLNGGV